MVQVYSAWVRPGLVSFISWGHSYKKYVDKAKRLNMEAVRMMMRVKIMSKKVGMFKKLEDLNSHISVV